MICMFMSVAILVGAVGGYLVKKWQDRLAAGRTTGLEVESQMNRYFVIKVGKLYLEEVNEEIWTGEPNYILTGVPSKAMRFDGTTDTIPDYLWNGQEGSPIKNIQEACQFLNGTLLIHTETRSWKEKH